MKTSLLLFSLAALLGSGWTPSAPLTEPQAVERQLDVATKPSPAQTQRVGPWDPNDEFNAAERMLERVREEGVVRIAGVHPSRTKYVFVCELYAEQQADSTSDSRPKTDLWLVNRDGSGLHRLTESGEGRDPEWSPSGAEVAFVDAGQLSIVDGASGEHRFRENGPYYGEWDQLHWAPNGRAIAALVINNYDETWIVVLRATDGLSICEFLREKKAYQWTPDNELLLDTGKFVFDWEAVLSYEPAETDEDGSTAGDPPEDPLRQWLLDQASTAGVRDISEYSLSPAGDAIAFGGSFGEASGPDLWVINRDGSGLRLLTTDAEAYGFAWSPSGAEIAYVDHDANAILIVDVGSERMRHLRFLEESWRLRGRLVEPSLSADGKAIAATEQTVRCLDGDSPNFVVFDAESGGEILFCRQGCEWNDQSELLFPGIGKFVFDWQSIVANRK